MHIKLTCLFNAACYIEVYIFIYVNTIHIIVPLNLTGIVQSKFKSSFLLPSLKTEKSM